MNKRLLVVLALSSLTALSVGQSPPPPPTPTITSQIEQNERSVEQSQPENDNSPPQAPAASVNQTISKPAEKNTQAQSGPDRNVTAVNWSRLNLILLTLFNGLLVGVGYLQWRSTKKQAGYMRDGLTETRRSVDAARASAGAAMKSVALAEEVTRITQRAVILIESVVAEPQIGEAHPYFSANSVLVYTLKNYGSTVAYEVKTKGTIYYPGGVRNFSDKAGSTIAGTTIAPQGRNEWISDPMFRAHPQQDSQITIANQGEGIVRYDIEVTYKDAFQKTHVYKAEGEYIPVLRAFTIMGSTSD